MNNRLSSAYLCFLLAVCTLARVRSFTLSRGVSAARHKGSDSTVSFAPTTRTTTTTTKSSTRLYSSTSSSIPTAKTVNQLKSQLVRACENASSSSKPNAQVTDLVRQLEQAAEQVGLGQASSLSGLLSGEWELLYSDDDITRSSPFFWAFRKAVPSQSDQIFGITDSIPAPLKEVGPAFQQIELDSMTQTGRFVSRVKVATLGGLATSIMTTRAAIVGIQGVDGMVLKIETTKPEQSSVVKSLLGPLGDVLNENAPPFPSGQALEQIQPGSSRVTMQTTFCDEGLRISRNYEDPSSLYVFRRREFASYEFM